MLAICTSKKDSIFFKIITGIDSFSYQSESHIPKELPYPATHIVIDNDEAGKKYGDKMNKLFGLKIITPLSKDVFEDVKRYSMEYLQIYYSLQLL
jgi:hypothetical protein